MSTIYSTGSPNGTERNYASLTLDNRYKIFASAYRI